MVPDYNNLIERIAKLSGLSVEEISKRVDAKCAKLSGLISKEGSAQIVASELGVSFEKERVKVSELAIGMRRTNITGKVVQMSPVREYTTKNGNSGKVLSLVLADDSGSVRTVLWDTNHIGLFESGKISTNDVVEISNASIRNNEIHLSGFSDIKKSKEVIKDVKVVSEFSFKKIEGVSAGERVRLRGVIVSLFEPKFFDVCPECGKKATDSVCGVHGKIIPKKRALISAVIDDGSENMKSVFFNEQIKELGISDAELENPENFTKKKEMILGEEYLFNCTVRTNSLFNSTELIVNGVDKVDIDSLISELKN
jgi:hypothetical protein